MFTSSLGIACPVLIIPAKPLSGGPRGMGSQPGGLAGVWERFYSLIEGEGPLAQEKPCGFEVRQPRAPTMQCFRLLCVLH